MKRRKIISALRFITRHPLTRKDRISAIEKYLFWQVRSRMDSRPFVCEWIENTKLIVHKNTSDAVANFYTGLHEFQGMSFLLHFLNKGDLFIDVGANIGSYTILASGVKKAKTIAFEPIPKTYQYLVEHITLNKLTDKVTALNIGLGSEHNIVKFTHKHDTTNHVMTPADSSAYIEVNIDKLDNILTDLYPVMLKIDVEGYEGEVLKGAQNTLEKNSLKAIVVETNNDASRYGCAPEQIGQYLLAFGFRKHFYDPLTREFTKKSLYHDGNTLFIRDHAFVVKKIKSSPLISILGKTY